MKRLAFAPLAALVTVASLAGAQGNPAGVRGDMLAILDEGADKIMQLAQAFPQEKYTWRPAAGVRSVSEVLMHVVGGNYYLLTFVGVQPPKPMSEEGEKITDKAQVAAALRESFDFVRAAIRKLSDADLEKAATFFGRQTTTRNIYLQTVTHVHEHLGQLIAYARSNGVVPPWSRGEGM